LLDSCLEFSGLTSGLRPDFASILIDAEKKTLKEKKGLPK